MARGEVGRSELRTARAARGQSVSEDREIGEAAAPEQRRNTRETQQLQKHRVLRSCSERTASVVMATTASPLLLFVLVLMAVSTCLAAPATRVGSSGRCNCACANQGDQVCAQEGRGPRETFPSKCHLECYNCTDNKQYVVVHKGQCEQSGRSGGR
ncbi:uncharacterized protein LOC124155389 isoform X2 [Ischnura elegans]|uniref:uncharacterized protein LOC124155389 isoform X2 n=1 Tax=Ischnura elegans TaxID=197161 RepID=UPI001ED8A80A|nr:uncharacterized protein LOC124155389 isoform X2 [Ischnura elegans]